MNSEPPECIQAYGVRPDSSRKVTSRILAWLGLRRPAARLDQLEYDDRATAEKAVRLTEKDSTVTTSGFSTDPARMFE